VRRKGKAVRPRPGRKQRRATPGSFKKGADPRRHVFTKQDCGLGWWIANILHPELRDWLRMRLFCYYSSRRASHGSQEDRHCATAGAV